MPTMLLPRLSRRMSAPAYRRLCRSSPCALHSCSRFSHTTASVADNDGKGGRSRVQERAAAAVPPVTHFTDDERLVQESTREWAQTVLLPHVRTMDEESQLSPMILSSLFEQGYMGLEIPEHYGGSGLSFTSSILVVEELSRIDPSVSILVDIHNTLVINALRMWGSESLQGRWLPRLARDTVSSFCLSEAGSGSDAFAMKTTALRKNSSSSSSSNDLNKNGSGNGNENGNENNEDQTDFVLNGEKLWISSAQQAGVFLVFANAAPQRGYKGITAFMVDPATSPGLTIGRPERKLGLRASSTCPVTLDSVLVPASCVLGTVGQGYKYCIEILNEGRLGIAAQQLGIAKGCMDVVLPYLHERTQFGQHLIAFQALQHQVSKLAVEIHALECMLYNACQLKESGISIVKEASMCKYYGSLVAERVASQSIEMLGGLGFTRETLVEKMYRDCKVGSIYEGTSNMQLQTIAKLIQKEYQDRH